MTIAAELTLALVLPVAQPVTARSVLVRWDDLVSLPHKVPGLGNTCSEWWNDKCSEMKGLFGVLPVEYGFRDVILNGVFKSARLLFCIITHVSSINTIPIWPRGKEMRIHTHASSYHLSILYSAAFPIKRGPTFIIGLLALAFYLHCTSINMNVGYEANFITMKRMESWV